MNEAQIRARIVEINTRKAQLDSIISSSQKAEDIVAARTEADALIEERGRLTGQLTEMTRNSAITALEVKETEQRSAGNQPLPTAKLTLRSALALSIGLASRKKAPTDEQKRNLSNAMTTTATTYVAPTADVDGVNNAGVFIATTALLDLLKEDKKLTPILNDILFTNIKGLTVYPYRKSRGTAAVKAEKSGTKQDSMEWGTLQLVKGTLQITLEVTDEIIALSDIDLGAYLLSEIENDLTEDWASELIYGSGADNHVSGVVNGVTVTVLTSGSELDGVISLLHSLPGKFRRGAKVYVSQKIYDKVVETKDTNKNYIFNVFNAAGAWTNVDGSPVMLDETLNTGDVVISNIARFFKANMLSPLTLESQKEITTGITTYVAKEFCASAAVLSSVAYAHLS
jgi:HK97 family phage major capsid protein